MKKGVISMELKLSERDVENMTKVYELYCQLNMPLLSLIGKENYHRLTPLEATRLEKMVDSYYEKYHELLTQTLDDCFFISCGSASQPGSFVQNLITGEIYYKARFTDEEFTTLQELLRSTYTVAEYLNQALTIPAAYLEKKIEEMYRTTEEYVKASGVETKIEIRLLPEVEEWVELYRRIYGFRKIYSEVANLIEVDTPLIAEVAK